MYLKELYFSSEIFHVFIQINWRLLASVSILYSVIFYVNSIICDITINIFVPPPRPPCPCPLTYNQGPFVQSLSSCLPVRWSTNTNLAKNFQIIQIIVFVFGKHIPWFNLLWRNQWCLSCDPDLDPVAQDASAGHTVLHN